MKKLLILALLISFCSCKKGDDTIVNTGLYANWTMTSYNAFTPPLPTLNAGDLTWRFYENNLIVQNNVGYQYGTLTQTGEHAFTEINDTLSFVFANNSVNKYVYSINNGKLIFTYVDDPLIADDEHNYTFDSF